MNIVKSYRNAKNANVYTLKIRTFFELSNKNSDQGFVFGLDVYLPVINFHFGFYPSRKIISNGKAECLDKKFNLCLGFLRNKDRGQGDKLYKYYLRLI
jgi:hypothetical protein